MVVCDYDYSLSAVIWVSTYQPAPMEGKLGKNGLTLPESSRLTIYIDIACEFF